MEGGRLNEGRSFYLDCLLCSCSCLGIARCLKAGLSELVGGFATTASERLKREVVGP